MGRYACTRYLKVRQEFPPVYTMFPRVPSADAEIIMTFYDHTFSSGCTFKTYVFIVGPITTDASYSMYWVRSIRICISGYQAGTGSGKTTIFLFQTWTDKTTLLDQVVGPTNQKVLLATVKQMERFEELVVKRSTRKSVGKLRNGGKTSF